MTIRILLNIRAIEDLLKVADVLNEFKESFGSKSVGKLYNNS